MSPIALRGYLNVPFADKDKAKELGARWDPVVRKWYITENCNPNDFARWHPILDEAEGVRITGPLFLAESTTTCWKCKRPSSVIALATEDYLSNGDPVIVFLQNIGELPPPLATLLSQRFKFFRKDFSVTLGVAYVLNHCPCGARLGDFYLHDEPGGCFCPTSPEEGARIILRRLPISGPILFKSAAYSVGSHDFAGPFARREPF